MSDGIAHRVLAVDGGGTRCRLVLDGPGGRLSTEAGPANVSSGFDAAIAQIRAGLSALAAKAGMDAEALFGVPAYVGLAGVTDAAMAARVARALPLRRARVGDDRLSALRGALGARDGIIAHFGTGAFFALQAGGVVRLAGGWGPLLGDEGSAFWLGRTALSATLDAVDGLTPSTPLTDRLLARFGAPGQIVAQAAEATAAEIAALAPEVTGAAAAGDATGLRLLRAGSDHIGRVLAAMGWTPEMALCLTGGLGPVYRDYLPAPLARALVAPMAAPIDGAVELAHAFAAEAT